MSAEIEAHTKFCTFKWGAGDYVLEDVWEIFLKEVAFDLGL